jgi:hypothetical protein
MLKIVSLVLGSVLMEKSKAVEVSLDQKDIRPVQTLDLA